MACAEQEGTGGAGQGRAAERIFRRSSGVGRRLETAQRRMRLLVVVR